MKFYRNILKSILFPILFLAINVQAQEYGMVMDAIGEVTLHRDNSPSYIIQAGDSIMDGDRLSVPDKSELILVSYGDCVEYQLTGELTVTIAWIIEKKGSGSLQESRKLPTCYRSEDIQSTGAASVLGGVTLRGFEDPVMLLRQEIEQGKISNSALITLLIHDLNYGMDARTKYYLKLLKQREPESEVVKKIELMIEK